MSSSRAASTCRARASRTPRTCSRSKTRRWPTAWPPSSTRCEPATPASRHPERGQTPLQSWCPCGPARKRETVWLCGRCGEIVTLSERGLTPFLPRLLPLDRAWRLRRDVERNAVHGRDLVDDPARDRLQQVVG